MLNRRNPITKILLQRYDDKMFYTFVTTVREFVRSYRESMRSTATFYVTHGEMQISSNQSKRSCEK